MSFIVSSNHNEFDFVAINDAFRALDVSKNGSLTAAEIKQVLLNHKNINEIDVDNLVKALSKDGHINYSAFIAAAADKHKICSTHNLHFAFHHLDTDNSGFITEENLKEVF